MKTQDQNPNKLILSGSYHLIGIGGIGLSALAKYLVAQGGQISGSDEQSTRVTDDLANNYVVTIYQGHHPEAITSKLDGIIYSPAIPETNPERLRGRALEIPEYSYPEALGIIAKSYFTITVSGTNGKTTTTTMITELLTELGQKPNAIIGEYLQKYNSNYIKGDSNIFILEACEYRDSFLNLHHDIAVITNITEDHLDYFKDLEHIKQSFVRYLGNKKGDGVLICDTTLPNLAAIVVQAHELGMTVVNYHDYLTPELAVSLPGEHNRQNAAAALAVIDYLKLDTEQARNYLANGFRGAKRRLELVGTTAQGALVYDDYAHNPEGITFLIESLQKRFPGKKVVLIFEPHLYSRTRDFKEAFGKAITLADHTYLFPTYRARESENHAEDFLLMEFLGDQVSKVTQVSSPETFNELFSQQHYTDDTVVVTAGAGPIWKIGKKLVD